MKKLAAAFGLATLALSMQVDAAPFKPSDLGGSPYIGNTYAEGGEVFSIKDTDGGLDDLSAHMFFENPFAGYKNVNTFGIYKKDDPTVRLEVFSGPESPSFFGKSVEWSTATDVCVQGGSCVSGINKNAFGFYLTNSSGSLYSQKSLNPGGVDQMLAYFVNGIGGVDFVLGWEDLANGGDHGYNDMVLGIHDVAAVPVPAAIWLFGSALAGLVGVSRRKAAGLAA
ncbi:MAG: DUF4114 domain-containing protein [Methylovulum sp.]|nr:DUF4114 domain-containing protein [Methylovulum sp.]